MSWPTWSGASAPIPTAMAAPVQSSLVPSAINSAPAVIPPGLGYSPEQWAQAQQQNWQQWAQWQQQYQQWHQQYGAEYQKSISALQGLTAPQQPPLPGMPNTGVPPPLPAEPKPPLPPEEPPVNQPSPAVPSYSTMPPKTGYSTQPPPAYGQQMQMPSLSTDQYSNQRQSWQSNQLNPNKRPYNNQGMEYEQNNKRPSLERPKQWSNQKPAGNQWGNQPPSNMSYNQPPPQAQPAAKPNIEELSEAEKKFDKEFAAWEAQFNKWKDQNANHPDKTQYMEYEKKWESWRNSLLERREQMRRKRLAMSGAPIGANKPVGYSQMPSVQQPVVEPNRPLGPAVGPVKPPSESPLKQQALVPDLVNNPPNLADLPPHQNDEPLSFQPSQSEETGESFLKQSFSSGGGIPGLDLVKEDEGIEPQKDIIEVDNDKKVEEQSSGKRPDLDAISKGINSILGDQKLLSMLSIVSQNPPSAPSTTTATNSTSNMPAPYPQEHNFNAPPPPHQFGETPHGGNFSAPPPSYQYNEAPPNLHSYNDHSNHSYEERSSHGENYQLRESVNNFDDQTRSSFTMGPTDQDTGYGMNNFPRNQFNKPPNRFTGGPPPLENDRGPLRPNFGSNMGRNNDPGFGANMLDRNKVGPPGGVVGPGNFPQNPSLPSQGNTFKRNDFNNRSNNFQSENSYRGNLNSRQDNYQNENLGPGNNFGRDNFGPGNNFENRRGNFGNSNFNRSNSYNDRYDNYDEDNNYGKGDYDDYENYNEDDDFEKYHEMFNDDEPGDVQQRQNQNQRPHPNQGPRQHQNREHMMNRNQEPMMNRNQEPMLNRNQDQKMNRNQEHMMNRNKEQVTNRNQDPMLNRNQEQMMNRNQEPMLNRNQEQGHQPLPKQRPLPGLMDVPAGPPAPPPVPIPEEEPIFEPTTVVDYDHKSSKTVEPDVVVVPIHMFDYRHKPLNRIPVPQRPKWLSEAVKFIREFDPLASRVTMSFERPPPLDRYSMNPRDVRRDDWRPDNSEDRYGVRNRSFEDRDKRFGNPSRIDRSFSRERDMKESDDFSRRERRPFNRDEGYSNTEPKGDDRNRQRFDDDSYEVKKCSEPNRIDTKNFEELSDDEINFENSELRKHQQNREDRDGSRSPMLSNPPNPNASLNEITMIEDIINSPGRFHRPPRIVIILRGPPGSGKTYLAKLIKDKEVENGGSAPRILSLDDYFMVEQEKEVIEDGKKVKVKEMVYEYEVEMEESYRSSFIKSFKKTVTDGYFPFIIVDNVNDKVKYFGEMWSFAKQNGFQVYICQLDLDPALCTKRNIHNRSEAEIEECIAGWEPTPSHHPTLDASGFLQLSITDVEMEEVGPPAKEEEAKPEEAAEDDMRSKWDTFDCSINNLAKLDGVSKPLRTSRTMEDYLQMENEWEPPKSAKPGQKRVRWADLEEQRQQQKMRALGFIVGHTNWNRMMDPTDGGSALTQTKYI